MTTENRCARCRFWEGPVIAGSRACDLLSDWADFTPEPPDRALMQLGRKASVFPFAGADGGQLLTDPDFGCVHFEARAD